MQGYYNYIPTYEVGGLIEKIAKAAGRAKIQGHVNLLSKSNSELSKLLSKLAKSLKGGVKLTEEESKKLVTLALDYRRSNIRYLNRRAKINELLAARRPASQKVTPSNASQSIPVENKGTVQLTQAQGTPSGEIKSTNPVPGTTLSARWKLAKTWMNNHPKLTVGIPLLALGTGPGRYITGNALKATQSNPANWFEEQPLQATNTLDFIMINGTKIPIKRSSEGYFVPAEDNAESSQTMQGGDATDTALAGITNDNLGISTQPLQGNFNIPDLLTINDLFSEDQW